MTSFEYQATMNAIRVGCSYGKKLFTGYRSSSGAQFHSQSELSRLAEQIPNPSATRKEPVTGKEAISMIFWCGVFLQSTGWIRYKGRGTYEECIGRYKMHMLQKELDRKKMESSEAYLEMIHRKMEALKSGLLKREKMKDWELKNYEREIAVLKSKLNEWTQEMDASASASVE